MKRMALVAIICAVLSGPAPGEEQPALDIHFINIGYGDAILIKSPSGQYSLIDTGYPRAENKLLSYLRDQGVMKLEYLIVTHPHADHLGNAVTVLREIGAENLRDNGRKIDRFDELLTGQMAEKYEKEFRGNKNYSVLKADDIVRWGDIKLDVLWPRETAGSADWNTNSLLMMLRYGEFKALLAGDFNTKGEIIILMEDAPDLKADLLKIGHHGSGDSSGPRFIKAVSPKRGVISVGKNPRDYPPKKKIEWFEEIGVRLYRTDEDGTIVFRYLPLKDLYVITTEDGSSFNVHSSNP